MNTILELNSPSIQTVKTKVAVWSLYAFSKNDRKYIFIPQDTELEVTDVYSTYGIDVYFQNKHIFLDYDQVEVLD